MVGICNWLITKNWLRVNKIDHQETEPVMLVQFQEVLQEHNVLEERNDTNRMLLLFFY